MYAQVEKSKANKSRGGANNVGQKKNTVKQRVGFVDNRPEVITQRKLQEKIRNCHQNDFQEKLKTSPIQRVVTQVWGIWGSSYDMTRAFNSEAEAQIFDNEQAALVAEQEAEGAEREGEINYLWNIRPSARNH